MRIYMLTVLLVTIVSCENTAVEQPSEIEIDQPISSTDIITVENEVEGEQSLELDYFISEG
jgi:hypothetical protein